jgi:hypothetical protein
VNEIAAVVSSGQERIAHGVYVNSAHTAVVLLKLTGFSCALRISLGKSVWITDFFFLEFESTRV